MTQERKDYVTWAAKIMALGVVVGILSGMATFLFMSGATFQSLKTAALEGQTYARVHIGLPDSVRSLYQYYHEQESK